MWSAKTFVQTRSGTGKTNALRQNLLLFRTLDEDLYRCTQARLRTFPLLVGD